MTDAHVEFPVIEVGLEKQALLGTVEAAEFVLAKEAPMLRAAVSVLGMLQSDPTSEAMLPIAADVALEPGSSVLTAAEVLPMIQEAVAPFTPQQLDPSRALTERWTQDWGAVTKSLSARLEERPELQERLSEWFLTKNGSAMLETRYAPAESTRPLYVVIGGANDQCSFRPTLALASMASQEFRREHGLINQPAANLTGEDTAEPGWLKDEALIAKLREHVAGRIGRGEILPRILVGGSGGTGRILKPGELEKVSKYLGDDSEPLYPERGWTEADAMLAGAVRVFGRTDNEPLVVSEFPSAAAGEPPAKAITFQSVLGPITFIATTGPEASLAGQLNIARINYPALFEGIDGVYGATTAIYSLVQRPALLEAAARTGNPDIDVAALGVSAHAAGIARNLPTLVGELTNYLRAVYEVARRSLEAADQNAQYDIQYLGGIAIPRPNDA